MCIAHWVLRTDNAAGVCPCAVRARTHLALDALQLDGILCVSTNNCKGAQQRQRHSQHRPLAGRHPGQIAGWPQRSQDKFSVHVTPVGMPSWWIVWLMISGYILEHRAQLDKCALQ